MSQKTPPNNGNDDFDKLPFPDAPISNAVAAKFTMYRTTVIPTNAGETQVRECDLAFHAGAEAMFDIMNEQAPDNEEDAMKFMASLKNELVARAIKYIKTRK